MQKACRQCTKKFEVTSEDLEFLDKLSPIIGDRKYPLPPPTHCPNCRQIRRIAQINQLNLYKRKCDATGKEIISNYHPSGPYKVFNQEYWWSDQWDAIDYGRDFDFSKTFFQQYYELSKAVPRPNLYTGYQYDENCEYTNYSGKNKDCYLIFDCDYCRDCMYCYSANGCTNCLDCHRSGKSELCYDALDSRECYNSKYITNSAKCTDSAFLDDCSDCNNCFMSFNLKHKKYFIYNKQGTKEEYEALMAQLSSGKNVEKFKAEFARLKATYPKKYYHGFYNENVSGDYLYNCKNIQESFDCNNSWDCKYMYQSFGTDSKDSMDCEECGDYIELNYECTNSGYNMQRCLFSMHALDQISNLFYCNHCHYSSNLFGCIGLKRKQYCILNKQYAKEEYEQLVPKIIEHMIKNGEWGEFFPTKISSFPYNESWAMIYQPLTKEEAQKHGYGWLEEDKKKMPQTYQVPDNIKDVPDSITQEILACTQCQSNFKIMAQELAFYRKQQIPIPSQCFKCRHKARLEARNPRQLHERACAKCQAPIRTTYGPTRPEAVYCEKCYLEAIY